MTRKYMVAFATCRGAEVLCRTADLKAGEVEELEALFAWLRCLGYVAAYSIKPDEGPIDQAGILSLMRSEFGDLLVDASLRAGPASVEGLPAFLMPVWPFDHEQEGLPAATANFLGLDLTVVAAPDETEGEGCFLPGLPGAWLVSARPICSDKLARKVPRTFD